MRSFMILALAGASVAAPFPFAKYFADKHYHPHPTPSTPYPPGGWPSYPTSPVIPGPTGTGAPLPPIPTGTGISPPEPPVIPPGPPVIPSISTPAIPTGTGVSPPIISTGTGTPYYPTPAFDRRGLEIDYKLAPRIPDSGFEARHHPRPHPHRPHGTGYPWGTGKPTGWPFPTGTSGLGKPTALPTPPVHIY
ncbi:hypothetical protein DPSP01_003187 [Paraphaeosphaeria sporulosa]|uniref:Uncharacterized protein n=1 Tax=Paraphaeosphaeria sporulosa TaxID=1460663 RepID=A0A177C428_9PLEO|nr:uncharacterized protein CC84DRAFT_197554 [Paraphaeosphaeria sporulosa]OAG01477.1 hypothetical protein CC84DRAFT_197554 [Paraphaeosphaeria sporulosa]